MLLERQDGTQKAKVYKVPELDEINRQYFARVLSFEQALALVSDLRDRHALKLFGQKTKPVTAAGNIKLLDSYWKTDYQFRHLVSPEAMKYDLLRALEVIGSLSLYTASQGDLVSKINKAGLKINEKRRVIGRLNQLLRFAKRDFCLKLPKKEFLEIKYLNHEEVRQVADKIGGLDGHLVMLAFSTGLRFGELFALTEKSVIRSSRRKFTEIAVNSQIRKDGTKALPKNRKSRKTKVLPYGEEALDVWLATPMSQRPRWRIYSKVVKDACRKLWKDKPEKHICFHDLRHSFAFEMRRLGESVAVVANLLGNSVAVCEEYYTGAGMADESLEALDERLGRQFK